MFNINTYVNKLNEVNEYIDDWIKNKCNLVDDDVKFVEDIYKIQKDDVEERKKMYIPESRIILNEDIIKSLRGELTMLITKSINKISRVLIKYKDYKKFSNSYKNKFNMLINTTLEKLRNLKILFEKDVIIDSEKIKTYNKEFYNTIDAYNVDILNMQNTFGIKDISDFIDYRFPDLEKKEIDIQTEPEEKVEEKVEEDLNQLFNDINKLINDFLVEKLNDKYVKSCVNTKKFNEMNIPFIYNLKTIKKLPVNTLDKSITFINKWCDRRSKLIDNIKKSNVLNKFNIEEINKQAERFNKHIDEIGNEYFIDNVKFKRKPIGVKGVLFQKLKQITDKIDNSISKMPEKTIINFTIKENDKLEDVIDNIIEVKTNYSNQGIKVGSGFIDKIMKSNMIKDTSNLVDAKDYDEFIQKNQLNDEEKIIFKYIEGGIENNPLNSKEDDKKVSRLCKKKGLEMKNYAKNSLLNTNLKVNEILENIKKNMIL